MRLKIRIAVQVTVPAFMQYDGESITGVELTADEIRRSVLDRTIPDHIYECLDAYLHTQVIPVLSGDMDLEDRGYLACTAPEGGYYDIYETSISPTLEELRQTRQPTKV